MRPRLEFDKALEINPNYADAHRNLGRALAMTGQLDQAIPTLKRRSRSIRRSPRPRATSAACWLWRASTTRPCPICRRRSRSGLIWWKPTTIWEPRCTTRRARAQEALTQWREVLRVDPNYVPAMNDAAHALAASPNPSDRNGAEAVRFAERAVQLSGARNPAYLDTLAAAYAEAGRFPGSGLNRAEGAGPRRAPEPRAAGGWPEHANQVV